MFLPNLACDPERVAHYVKQGIRELYFHGGNTEQETYVWFYKQGPGVICEAQSVFNWPDEVEHYGVQLTDREYLDLLSRARLGENAMSTPSHAVNGDCVLQLAPDGTISVRGAGYTEQLGQVGFDSLFLDSLSILENSEPYLRSWRTISVGLVEGYLLELVRKEPAILHGFSARQFEYFIGAFLSDAGFSNVRLSRYVKDGGYDLWCIYCEGDKNYAVVVEVKHYVGQKVGLEIVDRINGVRDRDGADKAIVFTSSSFSATAKKKYASKSERVALIDFERLTELLGANTAYWKKTASGLWTLPLTETRSDADDAEGKRQKWGNSIES